MKSVKWISLSIAAMFTFGVVVSTASAYNVPAASGAKKLTVPLVKNFTRCTAPTNSHTGLPPAPSCSPVTSPSTLDFGVKGKGTVTLAVVKKNTKDNDNDADEDSPTDQDITVTTKLKGMEVAGVPYSGSLGGGSAGVRITDLQNAAPADATVVDITFPVLNPPAQSCLDGKCTIQTSADAAVPGVIVNGALASIQIGVGTAAGAGQIVLNDGGGNAAFNMGLLVP